MKQLTKSFFVLFAAVLCLCTVSANALAKKHAYTCKEVGIYDKSGKEVAKLGNGLVFSYSNVSNGWTEFNYFGKKRYVQSSDLILDNSLKQFILNNPSRFGRKLSATKSLKVYSKKSIRSKSLKKVSKGTEFKSFGFSNGWYKVQLDSDFGYVDASLCKSFVLVDVVEFPSFSGKGKGEKIVGYARKFIGNPYVWGGTSLTSGCDCSGFVQSVFKNFGINLPRCSSEQACVGKEVPFSSMKPGDLIFYYRGSKIGHVTIYAGNGMCVQARGSAYGIVTTKFDYSTPAFAKRII